MAGDGCRHHRCTGHHQAAPEAFQLSECVANDGIVRICLSLSGTDDGAQFYLFKGHGKFSAGVSVNELGNVGWLGPLPGQHAGTGFWGRPLCTSDLQSKAAAAAQRAGGGGTVRLEQGRTQQQSRVLQMHADGVLCPEEAMCCMESMNVACWVLRAGGT